MNVRVVVPLSEIDPLSVGLRELTRKLVGEGHREFGGFFGGDYGYGVDFENEVFKMHPFCWCEEDDCPWCGGCQVSRPEPEHALDCYQSLVHADLLEEGFVQASWTDGPYAVAPQGWSTVRRCEVIERVRRKWCDHFGLSFPEGSAVHCTCGAMDAWRIARNECTCDFCTASGVWAKTGAEPGLGAPNFWHKPSGFKVWWYKYIGRDMELVNPNEANVKAVITECLESI